MLTTDDRLWFEDSPDREYRSHVVPRHEAARWDRPPAADRTPWRIVRRSDGVERRFTLPPHSAPDDTDFELAAIFEMLSQMRQVKPSLFPPSPGGTLARIEQSLSALLAASAPYEPDAAPAVAYREEMRRRGREALALGGRETLDYLAHRLAETIPARAEVHAAILSVAWDGLTRARL